MKIFKITGMVLFLACSSLLLWGQMTGTINGKVTTASGAAVPSANVIITETQTGASQKVLTATDGSFSVSGLAPGMYTIEVQAPGFKRLVQQNVILSPGATLGVSLALSPGNIAEVVRLTGRVSMLQNQTGERSEYFSAVPVQELPIKDRNYQELTGLMPGVTPPGASLSPLADPERNRIFAANGQSYISNNWMVDGGNNNEPFFHISGHVPSAEAISDVNVLSANYNASYGRAGGLIVNPTTSSGSNDFHGKIYWFNSVSQLRARDFFNSAPNTKGHFTSNLFGADIGGPVAKDKLFFFLTYEGSYLRYRQPKFTTVPTQEFRQGDFSSIPGLTLYNPFTGNPDGTGRIPFANNQIPGNMFSPAAEGLLPFIPLPNQSGIQNNFVSNSRLRDDTQQPGGRIDYRMSDKTSFFVNYRYSRYFAADHSPLGDVVGDGGESRLRTHNAFLGATHIFSADLLTEARFTYNRYRDVFDSLNVTNPLLGLGVPGFDTANLPRIQVQGMSAMGAPASYPLRGVDNTFQWANNWSWHTGRHDFKWGTDIRRLRVDGFRDFNFGPGNIFDYMPGATASPAQTAFPADGSFPNAFAGFLVGTPSVVTQSTEFLSPSYRTTQFFGFLGDTVQVHKRLTLDLGVRYDVYTPATPAHIGGLSNYDPNTNLISIAGIGMVDSRSNVKYDYKNVSPRFGFAYRLSDRSVVRGGYSLNYFPTTIGFAAGGLFPAIQSIQQGVPGSFATVNSLATLLPLTAYPVNGQIAANPEQPLTFLSQDRRTPYVQTYNLTVERQLFGGMVANVAYVGTLGRHLPYQYQWNAASPGTGIAGLPLNQTFGRTASTLLYDTGANSNYNSLQAGLTRRFSSGLGFTVSYTYSKALDEVSSQNMLINSSVARTRGYGPADFDRKHMFNFSHVWELPFGAGTNRASQGWLGQVIGHWQLNGILRWASGTPFTVTADPLFCNCPGNVYNYANVTGPVTTTSGLGPGDLANGQFFNTSAFTQPAAGTIGDAGRNSLRGPNLFSYNMSVFRMFPIHERFKLQFRTEFYNLTNTPTFANPVSNINSANFGQITQTLATAVNGQDFGSGREVKFALRLMF
jgi:outer membrane receptor protein involved in Fe transport